MKHRVCNILYVKKVISSNFSEYGSHRHRPYDRRISDCCLLRFLIRKRPFKNTKPTISQVTISNTPSKWRWEKRSRRRWWLSFFKAWNKKPCSLDDSWSKSCKPEFYNLSLELKGCVWNSSIAINFGGPF